MALTIPTKGAPGQRKPTARKAPAKKAPGKALAVVKDPKQPSDLTKAEAQKLTDKIKAGVTNTIKLLDDAWEGRVWIPLGHKTFPDWINQELGGAPLQLATLKRREAVQELVTNGWSTRAIAAATGTGKSTIEDDIAKQQLAGNRPVETKPDLDGDKEPPPLDVDEAPLPGPEPLPATRTGLDGKQHPAKQPNSLPKPEIPEIVVAAKKLAKALEADTVKLCALYDRDDYEEHRAAVDLVLEVPIGDFLTLAGPVKANA